MTKLEASAATSNETVYIVDDDLSVCEALCDLCESIGLRTKHYSSAELFLNDQSPNMAGCLLLDVRLPGMSGMELQEKLTASEFTLPIIIMTAHGDIPMVRKALKAGAVEFLTKPFQHLELLQAIRQAFAYDSAQRSSRTVQKSILLRRETLSQRERQVMDMVTSGLTNSDIAAMLDLSVVTVKLHRGQVMEKMKADSFAHLVKMAERIKRP